MTTTDRCRIDPSRPCGACSAPGPDQCPYLYLLADPDTDEEPEVEAATAAPEHEPA
jgi:hypothetical protein